MKSTHKVIDSESALNLYDDVQEKVQWNGEQSAEEYKARLRRLSTLKAISELVDEVCHSEEDVHSLNLRLTRLLVDINKDVEGPRKNHITKKSKPRIQAKNRWFDASCIILKREVNKLAGKYGRQPRNDVIRIEYYAKKKEYKRLIKHKKYLFYKEINEDILQDGHISWKDLKTPIKKSRYLTSSI